MDYDKEKLGKIVELAKRGIDGEKANALRLVKEICKKHKLNFKEVMEGEQVTEYEIKYKTDSERQVIAQTICRYGYRSIKEKTKYNEFYKKIFFETTVEKYLEVLHAIDILVPIWRKEKERMQQVILFGFLEKHQLFYQPTKGEIAELLAKGDNSDPKLRRAGTALAGFMEDANMIRRLKSGK